jgi:hypothetical protein
MVWVTLTEILKEGKRKGKRRKERGGIDNRGV